MIRCRGSVKGRRLIELLPVDGRLIQQPCVGRRVLCCMPSLCWGTVHPVILLVCINTTCEITRLMILCRLSVCRCSMETFPEASGRFLREFKLQLSHRPLLVSAERLLQLTAVNMFSVDNTVPKGNVCSTCV